MDETIMSEIRASAGKNKGEQDDLSNQKTKNEDIDDLEAQGNIKITQRNLN